MYSTISFRKSCPNYVILTSYCGIVTWRTNTGVVLPSACFWMNYMLGDPQIFGQFKSKISEIPLGKSIFNGEKQRWPSSRGTIKISRHLSKAVSRNVYLSGSWPTRAFIIRLVQFSMEFLSPLVICRTKLQFQSHFFNIEIFLKSVGGSAFQNDWIPFQPHAL